MLFQQFLNIDQGRSLDYQPNSVFKKKQKKRGRNKNFSYMQPVTIFSKEGKLTRLNGHGNVCFGLQYIASVTTTHRVSLVDVAGPSTECSSAVASYTFYTYVKLLHPIKIHFMYHQNTMSCQVTQTTGSPRKIQNL